MLPEFVTVGAVECEVLVVKQPMCDGTPCRCFVDLSTRRVFISSVVRPIYRRSLLDRSVAQASALTFRPTPLVGAVA